MSDERWRELRTTLLIGLSCLLVYNTNLRAISAGDAYPARYLPFAIWHDHTIRLDPVETLTAQGRGKTAFWIEHQANGHSISLYPVVVPVVLAPLYLPAIAYLNLRGWTDQRLDRVARIMEKLCASGVAALSASLLYVLLRRRASKQNALALTVAYAFGSTTWVISSQGLWQHGLGQLFVVGALLLLTGACTPWRALWVGVLCGLLVANRPPDAILAAVLGTYGLFWARRRTPMLVAGAVLTVGILLLYNLGLAGNPVGAYALRGKATYFQHDLLPGIAGVLFSPMRGLFVFSPFLLLLPLALRRLPRERSDRGLFLAMGIAVVLQILLYAKADWRAGVSWGARYMTDLLPMLMWMMVPAVEGLRGFGRAIFRTAVGVAVVIEAIGAFWYTGDSDLPLFVVPSGTYVAGSHAMQPAWEWRNAPFIASLRQKLAPRELLLEVRGSFDGIEAGGHPVDGVNVGEEVAATGWALAGHATPWQAAIVIDGEQTIGSRAFVDRPDVREALKESSPAGWRLTFSTAGLAPGEHRLTALAWGSEKGEGRFIAERKLQVRAASRECDDLEACARTAERRLIEHQQADGYWLTSHTTQTRFEAPRKEMNTFLTALLVDLLGPLGGQGPLGASVTRARQHLTRQIEATGLVRYHGLPDGPGIGTLGCAITPDTDDTALTWRIAPGSDLAQRSNALSTLGKYRTEEGLYRTWLAPRDAYQCLNLGSDPNPPDIAIQMHTLLWLADVQPSAAHALCKALTPLVDQDRIWVYYRVAPLVPLLRVADLRRAGCELELHEPRTQTSVPGQDIWVSAAQLLEDASSDEREVALRQLAQDDFAHLQQNPPLLYHNDLTATVRRYYWSEDAGYALWLRLYDRHAHFRHPPHDG